MNIKLIAVLVVLAIMGFIYGYYKDNQNKIQELEDSVLLYKDLHERADLAKRELEKQNIKQTTELTILQKKQQQIRKESNELEVLLSKHNLKDLAKKKPGLIQNRINNATMLVIKNLELITELPTEIPPENTDE